MNGWMNSRGPGKEEVRGRLYGLQSAPHRSPVVGTWPTPSGSSVECRESGGVRLELVPRANWRVLFCPREEETLGTPFGHGTSYLYREKETPDVIS